jgi:hypothetical protein
MPFSCPAGSNNEAQNFLARNGQVIVRMRGLPYDCTPKQVVRWRFLPFSFAF